MRGLGILGAAVLVAACSFGGRGQQGDDVRDGPPGGDDGPMIDGGGVAGRCAPLPPDPAAMVVTDVTSLRTALTTAPPGTTIALADGVYSVAASAGFSIQTPGITLRSASNNASNVVIDGGLASAPLVLIGASNVTVAAVTIAHASTVGLMVVPSATASANLTGTRIYDVTFDDDGGPAIRIFPANGNPQVGPWADGGTIACSRFVATPAGADHCVTPNQLGIDGVAIRDWTIRDNELTDVICAGGYRRNIWLRSGSRDTVVTDNHIVGSNMNIMLGGGGTPRTYSDGIPAGCAGFTPDHWGGVVCNNTLAGLGVPPVTANTDFEEGIALWSACDTWVVHNTIVSPAAPETFHDIEYRFAGTYVHLVNNLLQQLPVAREGGPVSDPAFDASNVAYTDPADFVNAAGGDLHLSSSAPTVTGSSIDALGLCGVDADGVARNLTAPTPGAYER